MIWFEGRAPTRDEVNAGGAGTMMSTLGMEFAGAGDDWLALRMPVDDRTRQPYGRLHGGASVALAETVGSIAASRCVDPASFASVGMEINANHVRPVREGWVTATARPEAMGRTSHVWSIRIEDEAGRLVCISRFTVAIIANDRR